MTLLKPGDDGEGEAARVDNPLRPRRHHRWGAENPREAWEKKLSMRRTYRTHRFAVKMAVVAVVGALAAAVDAFAFKVSTVNTVSTITADTVSSGADAVTAAGAAGVHVPTGSQRALLNERGHLASAALHGGRGAEGTSPPQDDPCSGTTINAKPRRCEYVTRRCPNDEGESLIDYRQFHYCTMDGWPALSVAALVGVVVLAFYVLGETAEEYFCPVVRQIADNWQGWTATQS